MRRLKVRYRPEAYDDLKQIYRRIYELSLDAVVAERFVARIRLR